MKKSVPFLLTLLLVLSITLLSVGCKKEAEEPAAMEEEKAVAGPTESEFPGVMLANYSEWEIGKAGGEGVFSETNDPKMFNIYISEEMSTKDFLERVQRPIVDYDVLTLEHKAELAESWELSGDGLELTVKLRDDLKWSDGVPLTAEDVVWGWSNVIYNDLVEGSMRDGFMVGDDLIAFEKVDDLTFKLIFPSVYADPLLKLHNEPLPKHIIQPLVEENGYEAFNSFWGVDTDVKEVVTCGPYVLDEYLPNQRVVLKKNPYWFRKDAAGNQLPYLDKITVLIVEDINAELLKFQAGETDSFELRGEDYATQVERKGELDFEIYSAGPDLGTQFLTINQNPIEGEEDAGLPEPKITWFNNVKFRQAVAHLVDRETIIDNVMFGFGYPQYSFVPQISPWYWDEVEDVAYKFDPEEAKRLLDELGMTDRNGDGIREDENGNNISFNLETNSDNTDRVGMGEIISQEMKKVGLDVTYKPGDFNTLVTRLLSVYDWDMIIIGLTGSLTPYLSGVNTLQSVGSLHMIEPGQESPRREWEAEIDRLYLANTTTTDTDTRMQTGYDLQKIWVEQSPWIYTANKALMFAFKTKYGNVKPIGLDSYDDWHGVCERLYVK